MKRLLAALCLTTALISAPEAQSADVALAPFYKSVTAMKPDGALGKVIAQEKIDTSIPGADAWRIAYISSDLHDKPTISTGLVIAPQGTPPAGGRPIVAWSHGTTGTAQNCGPSQVLDPAQDLNEYFLIGGTSWTDFGVPAATDFIKQGYVLVATDYQGLGGGGKHQYAIAATQGRDLINSIRAVGSLGLSGDNRKAVIYGWSQGGGSVLAAASSTAYLSQKNTAFDDIEIIGGVALAPFAIGPMIPKEALTDEAAAGKMYQALTAAFDDNVFNFAHLAMSLWAMEGTFPGLKLTDLFTVDGARIIDEIQSKKCMHAGADTYNFNLGTSYKDIFKPQPANVRAWVQGLFDGSIPADKPIAPLQIYWGDKDTVVPPVQGEIYRQQKCAIGANIERIELPGQSHFTTPPAAQPMYTQWVKDRFDGKPLADACKS
jgi:pimeloyl-ACP methyl ester carboxylesterase